VQHIAKLGGSLKALVRILGQPFAHNSFEGFGNVLAVFVEAFQAAVAHHEQNVEIVLRGEQAFAHEHLGQDNGHGEEIAATVQFRAPTCSGDM